MRSFAPEFLAPLWTVLLGLALSCSSAGAAVTNLSVMSFNIWGQGGRSLTRCIDAIRNSGADIVGLQECNAATAQTIGTSLGWHHLGAAGTSIVSRYPIEASMGPWGSSSGVAIELSPGQRVYLFNCHLPAYPYGPYSMREGRSQDFVLDQEEQTRMPALLQALEGMAPYLAGAVPCFLTGDFNAPSHLDYEDFPWPTSRAPYALGLRDAYREIHDDLRTYPPAFAFDDPGITWTPIVAEEPNDAFDRIDFVYYSADDGVTPVEAYELDGRNSSDPWPSDHRAVFAAFQLIPPLPQAKATLPSPAHQATHVAVNPTLSWMPGTAALSHDIYLGTNPPGIFLTNQATTAFQPAPLEPGTSYYWRIDERTASEIVTGDVWSFTTRSVQDYEWRFLVGNLAPTVGPGILSFADTTTANMTHFGFSDGEIIPLMAERSASYLYAPAFTAAGNGYLASFTETGPNGGGVYLNQFTLIWDLLIPAPLGKTPLFNTNPQNANDADLYVDSAGRLGIGALGYSPAAAIKADTWHRIAFVADLSAGIVRYHVDGQQVFTGNATLDGRHSLYSSLDPGPDLLLFNEGDPTGVYTHEVYCSTFFFTDRPLNAEELQVLGGPIPEGVTAGLHPIQLSIRWQDSALHLSWRGGGGLYQVQKSSSAESSNWVDDGDLTSATSTIISTGNDAAFYRITAR